ncbi:MAG: hypothetical protein O2782_22445, partial [bacterium]|nr:hypothetical protein [bacterium]
MKDSRNQHRWTWMWICRGIYCVYVTVFSVVSLEIGARVLLEDVDAPETVLDQALPRLLNSAVIAGTATPLGVQLSPNAEQTVQWGSLRFHVRTNSLGFRGREPAARAPGEHRILFLGDSMVYGHGLEEEETLPHQVEQLGRNTPDAIVTFNGAISGMNTAQELAAAQRLLPILRPDQVILGYFVGNDPLANLFTEADGLGNVSFHEQNVAQLRSRLDDHLRPLLASVAFRAIALRYYVPRLRYVWSEQAEVLDRSVELLLRTHRACEQAGARFAVLIIYPRDGVAGGVESMLSGSRGMGRTLATRLRDAGLRVLDSSDYWH